MQRISLQKALTKLTEGKIVHAKWGEQYTAYRYHLGTTSFEVFSKAHQRWCPSSLSAGQLFSTTFYYLPPQVDFKTAMKELTNDKSIRRLAWHEDKFMRRSTLLGNGLAWRPTLEDIDAEDWIVLD